MKGSIEKKIFKQEKILAVLDLKKKEAKDKIKNLKDCLKGRHSYWEHYDEKTGREVMKCEYCGYVMED